MTEASEQMASATNEGRGAVFTRNEVVEFVLDLTGYTVDQPLFQYRLLEPSIGDGDFLVVAAERLLQAYDAAHPHNRNIVGDLSDAIRAVELHPDSIHRAHAKLIELLDRRGVSAEDGGRLLDAWLIEGDFLLVELPHHFTHAVGNPPYLRQELIPDVLMAEYRQRYATIYDRADIYVPFIERCLSSLDAGGTLGFICADRWMKNRYGGPLRAMVAKDYHLKFYVDMVDTPAFQSEVSTYPAITIITREEPGSTRVAHRPSIDRNALSDLARSLHADVLPTESEAVEVTGITNGSEPWILQSFDQLAIVRRLEANFPKLEEAGCRVGIGVATGADHAFIGPFDELDVEPDRKLPLVMTKDIKDGNVKWRGLGVINPFADDGSLVDLAGAPRLAKHLERHADTIRKRNCAQRNPTRWYRTIDRIYPDLMRQPKLLIPDIKGDAHIVYEDGQLYPHHNLYFITSEEWNLKALQAVLRSGIARLFVSIYSTQMRGGYLRFQAQYLRRIRIPRWSDVPIEIRQTLIDASDEGNVELCNQAVSELYDLNPVERAALHGIIE